MNKWVKKVKDEALTFKTSGVGRLHDVTLVPFYRLHGQRYSLYWNLLTEQQYIDEIEEERIKREKELTEKKAREERISERMIDQVYIGIGSSENEHNLQQKNSFNGEHLGKNWRDAREGGWFSYRLKVEPDAPMVLECTYLGGDAGRRFGLLIDDFSLGTVEIEQGHSDGFFYKEYKVPLDVTKGKNEVTVKFQAPKDGLAGGVFGLAMFK
ncbi:MAG: hypothetical protein HQ517_03175 [SAR324 cluster bacterium]|nr:hypothetical protein [SAR324 cluster bacterium]